MTTTTTLARTAADRFVARCLRRATSLFTPGLGLWSATRLGDLAARLVRAAGRADDRGHPDRSPFTTRWQRMLVHADGDTVRLAAEVLYVHLLFPARVSGDRKRALLEATLDRLDDPPTLPDDLDAALDEGVAPVGVAYTRRRLTQLAWLATAGRCWRELAPAERRAALEDPWRLADALAAVEVRGGGAQRAALLHLVHPATFAPVTSAAVRRAILDAHAAHVPDDECDPDRALAAVRAVLARTHGRQVSFFDPEIARTWQ